MFHISIKVIHIPPKGKFIHLQQEMAAFSFKICLFLVQIDFFSAKLL